MPESRKRKNVHHRSSGETSSQTPVHKPSPRWWAPVMVGLLLLGLLFVVITYLSGSVFPIPALKQWNVFVGFIIMLAGMIMSMGWR